MNAEEVIRRIKANSSRCMSCVYATEYMQKIESCDLCLGANGKPCKIEYQRLMAGNMWPELCPHRGSSSAAKT